MKKRLFTLIELLVVIAIIAILASLLLPMMSRARYIARNTVCISNLKQVALVYVSYADDSDGLYPTVWPDYTETFNWFSAQSTGARVHQYYLRTSSTKDIRPFLRDYAGEVLDGFMKCPLATPTWHSSRNIDTMNGSRSRSPYMLYTTVNQASKHFYITERMKKIGDAFECRSGTASGKAYRIIASDLLKADSYGRDVRPMLVSTQSAITGSQYEGGQWINGPNGWELFPDATTYANFAQDDGSVHSFTNVSIHSVKNGYFLQAANADGYFLPSELADY